MGTLAPPGAKIPSSDFFFFLCGHLGPLQRRKCRENAENAENTFFRFTFTKKISIMSVQLTSYVFSYLNNLLVASSSSSSYFFYIPRWSKNLASTNSNALYTPEKIFLHQKFSTQIYWQIFPLKLAKGLYQCINASYQAFVFTWELLSKKYLKSFIKYILRVSCRLWWEFLKVFVI